MDWKYAQAWPLASPVRFARQPWAPALPVLAAGAILTLVLVVHAGALSSGRLYITDHGRRAAVPVPEISITAAVPPESYIWTFGVMTTFICLLCPMLMLIYEVLHCSASGIRGVAWGVAKIALVIGCIFLVCLATVTQRGTILEVENKVPNGFAIHQIFALSFFVCSWVHMSLVLCLQIPFPFSRPRAEEEAALSRPSCIVKALCLLLLVLSISGFVPTVALAVLPERLAQSPKARFMNFEGIRQRTVVFGIICFIASYSLDLWALQQQQPELPEKAEAAEAGEAQEEQEKQ